MPDIDVAQRINCALCGVGRLEDEIVRLKTGEKEIYRGCIFCVRVALELPHHLPKIVAAAVFKLMQDKGQINCSAEAERKAYDEVRKVIMELRDDAWRQTRRTK